MSKKIATMALAAALAVTTVVPAAQAAPVVPAAQAAPGRGRNFNGHSNTHHAYNGGGGYRGRGHSHGGQWLALGILGAVAAAAVANPVGGDCYYRGGQRYCD